MPSCSALIVYYSYHFPCKETPKITKSRLFLLTALCLVATVPWFFKGFVTVNLLGMPPWAFFSLAVTTIYALLISFLLGRYWPLLAGEGKEEQDGEEAPK